MLISQEVLLINVLSAAFFEIVFLFSYFHKGLISDLLLCFFVVVFCCCFLFKLLVDRDF